MYREFSEPVPVSIAHLVRCTWRMNHVDICVLSSSIRMLAEAIHPKISVAVTTDEHRIFVLYTVHGINELYLWGIDVFSQ